MSENLPELNRLEALLASLTPQAPALDRDRLMYLAGQASCRSSSQPGSSRWKPNLRGTVWPAATAAMTLVALTLALASWNRPAAQVVERIVYLPAAVESPRELPISVASEQVPAALRGARDAGLSSPAAARQMMLSRSKLREGGTAPYIGLRDQVLAMGFDSLPRSSPSTADRTASASASYADMMHGLLEIPAAPAPKQENSKTRQSESNPEHGA